MRKLGPKVYRELSRQHRATERRLQQLLRKFTTTKRVGDFVFKARLDEDSGVHLWIEDGVHCVSATLSVADYVTMLRAFLEPYGDWTP